MLPLNSRPDPRRPPVSLPRALSKLGLCSRTQALELIAAGRVSVNGRVSRDSTLRVSLDHDQIALDGVAKIQGREPIVIALHKPVGYVTTRSDPQGRRTVYELLPKLDRFVFPVGRLDKDTSGLLILTDDHQLGEALTNPKSHVPKTYEVRLDREPDESQLDALRKGVDIGRGQKTRPSIVDVVSSRTPDNAVSTLRMVLDEGKNRQVRRMVAAAGLSIVSLTRVGVGAYPLGAIPQGHFVVLSPKDILLLKNDAKRAH